MASFFDLKGTAQSSFKIGKGGPIIKNNSSVLQLRNTNDSAYVSLECLAIAPSDSATSRTNLKVPASDSTGITGADAVTNLVSLTQAEYDAIVTPNTSTLYFITT
jgi:hypothetical protein